MADAHGVVRAAADEQPEVAPAQLAPNLRRQEVAFATKEPRGNADRRYAEHLSLLRAGQRPCDPLRRPRRPRRLHLDRRAENHAQGRVAGLASAAGDDRSPALSAALHGRRPRQSAWRARDVSRHHRLSHPRHQPALDDRQVRLLGLHRHAERGRLRPVRSRQGRHPRGRAARRPAAGVNHHRLGSTDARTRAGAAQRAGERSRHAADRGAAAAGAGDGALANIAD